MELAKILMYFKICNTLTQTFKEDHSELHEDLNTLKKSINFQIILIRAPLYQGLNSANYQCRLKSKST